MPPELLAKKATLVKMCKRLEDDKGLMTPFLNIFTKANVGALVLIGGGTALWIYREQLGLYIRQLFSQTRRSVHVRNTDEILGAGMSLDAIREARLRKFQQGIPVHEGDLKEEQTIL